MTALSRYEDYSPGEYGLPHMGEVFADHRKRKGHSQETFAIICGVDKQTVVYWENQKYLADMKRRIFLCKVLSIPPAFVGLTWRSLINVDQGVTSQYIDDSEHMTELLKEHAYGLYEDILTLAHNGPNRYSPNATYRFYKHQQELEGLIKQTPEIEKESWIDLLCRYYQHATFVALHHKKDDQALFYINQALDMASSLEIEDVELIGTALYRRARVHLTHGDYDLAKQDSLAALEKAEHARGPLKGNAYLLAAETSALFASGEEKIRKQCRKWQEQAANLLYQGKVQEDETFLWFDLYAVHHERAKTLARFSLFHSSDDELVELLKNPHVKANEYLKDAQNALETARAHMASRDTGRMDYSITQAKVHLIGKEFEESARETKAALQMAHVAHSQKGIKQIRKIYSMLNKLAPQNPYVLNLGVELGVY
jgi:DNA-binding XRE family transcriptional regulator